MIRWIAFDVGETLFDERGLWGRWADWIGIDRHRFISELKAIIGAGRHHREVFEVFQPGFDIERAEARRRADGDAPGFIEADLFPDVRALSQGSGPKASNSGLPAIPALRRKRSLHRPDSARIGSQAPRAGR